MGAREGPFPTGSVPADKQAHNFTGSAQQAGVVLLGSHHRARQRACKVKKIGSVVTQLPFCRRLEIVGQGATGFRYDAQDPLCKVDLQVGHRVKRALQTFACNCLEVQLLKESGVRLVKGGRNKLLDARFGLRYKPTP
jgi:hypothetical protein